MWSNNVSYSSTFGIGSCDVLVKNKGWTRPIHEVFSFRESTLIFENSFFARQEMFLERENYMSRSQWESYWSWKVSGFNQE